MNLNSRIGFDQAKDAASETVRCTFASNLRIVCFLATILLPANSSLLAQSLEVAKTGSGVQQTEDRSDQSADSESANDPDRSIEDGFANGIWLKWITKLEEMRYERTDDGYDLVETESHGVEQVLVNGKVVSSESEIDRDLPDVEAGEFSRLFLAEGRDGQRILTDWEHIVVDKSDGTDIKISGPIQLTQGDWKAFDQGATVTFRHHPDHLKEIWRQSVRLVSQSLSRHAKDGQLVVKLSAKEKVFEANQNWISVTDSFESYVAIKIDEASLDTFLDESVASKVRALIAIEKERQSQVHAKLTQRRNTARKAIDDAETYRQLHTGLLELLEVDRQLWNEVERSKEDETELVDEMCRTLVRLSIIENQYERFAKASRFLESRLEIRKAHYGLNSWKTINARNDLRVQQQFEGFTDAQREEDMLAESLEEQVSQLTKEERIDDAIEARRRRAEIYRRLYGDKSAVYSRSLGHLAELYHQAQRLREAKDIRAKAIKIDREVLGDRHPDLAKNLHYQADLCSKTIDYPQAKALLTEVLAIHEALFGSESPAYGDALHDLAFVCESLGDYKRAVHLMLQAKSIERRATGTNDPRYIALLGNLAFIYHSMGDFAQAESVYLEARKLSRDVFGKESHEYAANLDNLAGLYMAVGEYARAESAMKEAGAIWLKVVGDEDPDYWINLNNQAVLNYRMGQYDQAIELFQKVIDWRQDRLDTNHPQLANSFDGMALVFAVADQFPEAIKLYEKSRAIRAQSLGIDHPDYATSLFNLGSLYQKTGDIVKAIGLLEECRRIRKYSLGQEHPSYTASLEKLALLYHLTGDDERAASFAEDALRNNVQYLEQTLQLKSEASGMRLLSSNALGVGALLSTRRLLTDTKPAETCQLTWEHRGLLGNLLRIRQSARSDSPQSAELYDQLSQVSRELAQLTLANVNANQSLRRRQRLTELNEQKEGLEQQLARISEAFRRDLAIERVSPTKLIDQLPEDVVVVDLIEAPIWNHVNDADPRGDGLSQYDAFVLRKRNGKHHVEWLHLGLAEEINHAVSDWLTLIRQGRGDTVLNGHPAQVLRERLWEPLEEHLAGAEHVIIIPDSTTHFLPWAALPGRNAGSYLLEDYTLSTALSGQELYRQITEAATGNRDLLLVGGVDYDLRQLRRTQRPVDQKEVAFASQRLSVPVAENAGIWKPLPGASNETEAIRTLWRDIPTLRHFSGAAADEAAVRSSIPVSKFVHLATHGFFADPQFPSIFQQDPTQLELLRSNSGEPLTATRSTVAGRNPLVLSGIVLAGANLGPTRDDSGLPDGDDGILTAQEVIHSNLQGTELVTLSACDTARGTEVAGGEGIYGLQRAFHLAGARHVVASLWKVDDQATAALMKLFYHNLWIKKQPVADALRNAQLTMLRNPDQIETLATSRGPNFSKTVQVTDQATTQTNRSNSTRTPIRLWAAFTHSGPPVEQESR